MTQKALQSTVNAKAELRKIAAKNRARLSPAERQEKSAEACRHFLCSVERNEEDRIALYWPMGDELDCRGIIQKLKTVGLPAIVGAEKPLVFRQFESADRLVPAAYGTHGPSDEASEILPAIVVLPLLAFDKSGARLGYGGGFYDRTIAAMKSKPKLVGLAFDVQEQVSVPTNDHDVGLDMVVTEFGLRHFS